MEYVRRVDTDAVFGEVTSESAKTNMTEFYKMLYTDALSQAYNRRYFEDRIRKKVVTAGIAMIDLDDFKASNDTYSPSRRASRLITRYAPVARFSSEISSTLSVKIW